MADKLESYFKKHLSDDSTDGDDWNIPSDNVWKNALPEIQKKRGIFIPSKYIYWLGLITIVGLVIALLLWNQNSDVIFINNEISETDIMDNNNSNQIILSDSISAEPQIDSESIDNSIQLDVNSQDSEDNKIDLTKSNSLSLKKTAPKEKSAITSMVVDSTSDKEFNSVKNNEYKGDITTTLVADKQNEAIIVITENDDSGSKTTEPPVRPSPTADSSNIQKPDYTTIIQSEISNNDIMNVVEDIQLENKDFKPILFKGKLGIGLYYSPTLTATYLTGDLVSGIEKTKPVYLYSGNYGIEIKYYLSNKFAIVSGIGRSEIRSWSKSNADFNYNSATEHVMITGEKENTSPVLMSSPFGTIETEVTYIFPGSDEIPDGEPMQSELETHQDVKYLTIPIGAEFNMINFSHLSWFAEGGISFNYATKDATKFNSRIIHYGNDMNVVGEEIIGQPTYKEYYFGYYVGIGIKYSLSNKIQLNSSLRYNGNISPVNKQDRMSTNIHAFNLKIGFSYFF